MACAGGGRPPRYRSLPQDTPPRQNRSPDPSPCRPNLQRHHRWGTRGRQDSTGENPPPAAWVAMNPAPSRSFSMPQLADGRLRRIPDGVQRRSDGLGELVSENRISIEGSGTSCSTRLNNPRGKFCRASDNGNSAVSPFAEPLPQPLISPHQERFHRLCAPPGGRGDLLVREALESMQQNRQPLTLGQRLHLALYRRASLAIDQGLSEASFVPPD